MARDRSSSPLKERNFAFYFYSRVTNLLGNTMAGVALAFAVLQIADDDPSALGVVLAAHTVPMVLLLLWGGVIADRFPRIAVIQLSNIGSAVTQGLIAGLVITDAAQVWMMVALSAVHGALSALALPALGSVLPSLVLPAQLQKANVLISLARGSLTIVGPALAATLVVFIGPGWVLALDAATWLVAAFLLGFVTVPVSTRAGAAGSGNRTLSDLREGWGYFRRTTWLWVVVLGFGFLNAVHAGAWFTLGPALAKRTFGAQGWGLILSAEALGLLVTTAIMLKVSLPRPLLTGMLGITLLGLPIAGLGMTSNVATLMGLALLAGAGTEIFNLGWNLALQENVPDEMLSRAYSYDALGSFVAMPIGMVAFGPLALAFGYSEVLIASGIIYGLLCLLILLSRSVRTLPRRETPVAAT